MPRGRPPLDVGTYGKITTTEERRPGDGKLVYRARTLYRGSTGRGQRVVRYGETKGRAEKALKLALAKMQAQTATEGITPHTTVTALAAAWMAEPHPNWRPNTREQYVRVIDNHIGPKMGGLRLSEVRASTVSRVITSIRVQHGPGPAYQAKKALSGMFRMAVLNDAMNANPAMGTVKIAPAEKKDVRSLTVAEETDLRDKLRSNPRAIKLDLPDLCEWMLATGCRIGEALAAQSESVDLEAGTWEINATVIRVKGEGLMIQPRPKTEAGWRRIAIPPYAVRMVRRRGDEVASLERLPGPTIFGNPRDKTLRDPSNATGDLREVLDGLDCPACNYTGWQLNDDGTFKMNGKNKIPCRLGPWAWVTSHVFRKTVATRLDEAGMSARVIADQLGHAKPSITQDVYMGRKVVNADAARILDR